MQNNLVFFLDVDNTLLDNDSIKEEIRKSLNKVFGIEEANHFWGHHDSFREEKKLVDFPNIIREYCSEKHAATCEIKLGQIFQGIKFKDAIYPHVPKVLAHLKTLGRVVIFSEGDMVYQSEKIEKSGLADMVDEVLLYEHKLDHVDELKSKYGDGLVFVEDKPQILDEIRKSLPEAFTILVCQGHYAREDHPKHKEPDRTIESIAELLTFSHTLQDKYG